MRSALALGTGAAIAYVLAAAPGGVWYDTQEIAAAAFRLGVSHPPGQALHSILGKAATLVPLGSVVLRTNVLSAIAAAIAVALVFGVARILARTLGASDARATGAGIAAAVAIGVGDALVGQATRTEVYAPAFALFLVGLGAAARWCEGPRDVRWLGAAGLAAGLAATLHPPAGISVVLATAWLAVLFAPRDAVRVRPIAVAAAGVVVGLAPLALLFARCRGALAPCWTVEMTPHEWVRYVAGKGYAANLQTGVAMVRAIGDALAFVLARTGWIPAAALAGVALVATLRSRSPRRWGVAYLGAFLLPLPLLAVMAFEEENPDVHGYLLPAFALLVCGAAAALASLRVSARIFAAAIVLGLVLPAALASRVDRVVRNRYVLPDALQEASMAELPPRALLLTVSDQMIFGAWYAQLVEGDRPDVVVMAEGLCGTRRQWADARRKRSWLDEKRARERMPAGATLQDGMAAAALELARGRAPRVSESPGFARDGAVSLGVVFDLDAAASADDRPLPRSISGELERHRDRYRDGGDRIYRILRQRRARGMLARLRPRAAARELASALWELGGRERQELESLPDRVDAIAPEPGFRSSETPWITDEDSVRADLATLAFRMGRADLSARILLPSVEAGNYFAVLLQADFLAREGRTAEAERLYLAFIPGFPEHRASAEMGLALLDSYRGRHDGARRHLALARRSEGAGEIAGYLGSVAAYIDHRARASAPPIQ